MSEKIRPQLSADQLKWIRFNLENGEHHLTDETVSHVMRTLREHNLVWKKVGREGAKASE